MITIALYNLKGGVGKTTTAINMAFLAAKAKKNTVLWDWDPQGAASWYLGADHDPKKIIKLFHQKQPLGDFETRSRFRRLTLVPADLSLRTIDQHLADFPNPRRFMRKLVEPIGENTSILIFDCPPSLSPAMEYLLAGVDLVLVPLIPTPLSVRATEQVLEFFAKKKRAPKHVVGFFNMVDQRRKLHLDTLENATNLPLPLLKNFIPMDAQVEAMATQRAPLVSYAPSSRSAAAYRRLWKEIAQLLRQQSNA